MSTFPFGRLIRLDRLQCERAREIRRFSVRRCAPGDERACRTDSLDQNVDSQGCNPDKVHCADDEEHAHQRPTAAEAINTVSNAHLKGTQFSGLPIGQQER